MNMQALLKQAQSMQKDMLKVKEEIDNTIFYGESSIVKVEVMGNKKIKTVKIMADDKLESDDIEMLEDMIVLAINNAFLQIDKITEEKMGRFGNIPGLF